MKKQLGILLLVLLATVGLSGAAAAQPMPTGVNTGPIVATTHFSSTDIFLVNGHRFSRNVFFRMHFRHFMRHHFMIRHVFIRHHMVRQIIII